MIIRSPPLQVSEQVWGLLRRGPGTTGQRGYAMTDGQIYPLNESGIEPSRETYLL